MVKGFHTGACQLIGCLDRCHHSSQHKYRDTQRNPRRQPDYWEWKLLRLHCWLTGGLSHCVARVCQRQRRLVEISRGISLRCRWQTRATQWLMPTVLHTDVDGHCDKLWLRPSLVYHTDHPTKLTAPETISRSKDMVGPHQNVNGLRYLTTPFQGWFEIRGVALTTVNLPTIFEVSTSTHYEDMKGDTKCRNRVVWGS